VLTKAVSPLAKVELLMVAVGVDRAVCWRRRRTKARFCIAARAAPNNHLIIFSSWLRLQWSESPPKSHNLSQAIWSIRIF